MRDDFMTGEWAENKQHFTSDIDKLVRSLTIRIGDVFAALHRVQFDAPWKRAAHRVRKPAVR